MERVYDALLIFYSFFDCVSNLAYGASCFLFSLYPLFLYNLVLTQPNMLSLDVLPLTRWLNGSGLNKVHVKNKNET